MMYSDKVMDHFANPRNVGVLADADGVGQVGNPVCGDMMTFYIKVKDDRLDDIKFQTFGCGAAIAVSSMVSEMAKGKTLGRGHGDHQRDGGRGARRAAQEQDALLQPRRRRPPRGHQELPGQAGRPGARGQAGRPPTTSTRSCACPYCDTALEEEDKTFCRACQIEFEECPACGGITKKGDAACVHCGKPLGGKA